MERHRGEPRSGWEKIVEGQGLVYGIPGRGQGGTPRPYWDESVHYTFSMDEVLSLEADVEVVHSMCLEAVEHVVTTERFRDFAIPEYAWEAVAASWRRSDPHVYGRFDLRYDGGGPAKLLEYNADTPDRAARGRRRAVVLAARTPAPTTTSGTPCTSARRAAGGRSARACPSDAVYFAWRGRRHGEDHDTVRLPAGDGGRGRALRTVGLSIEDDRLGLVGGTLRRPRRARHPARSSSSTRGSGCSPTTFGPHVPACTTRWLEPPWKVILSNKAMLAVLWELFPDQPDLLPAYLDQPGMLTEYVRKPRLGREGANIAIVSPGSETQTGGVYGEEGYVYQLFAPLPEFDGYRPALGAWIVGDTSAGLGIRETVGLVTDDGAAFVPHRIPPGGSS